MSKRKSYGAELPLPVTRTQPPAAPDDPAMAVPSQLYTLSEAAKRLAVCDRTLRRLIQHHKIRAVYIGAHLRISEAEIRRVIADGARTKDK